MIRMLLGMIRPTAGAARLCGDAAAPRTSCDHSGSAGKPEDHQLDLGIPQIGSTASPG